MIYLIRHGKTRANEAHLYCGSTDLPLSEAGKAELVKLHYGVTPERFLTSGMRRTNETLRILFGDVPFTPVPEFREVDFGAFEMHSYEELRENAGYQRWITGDNEKNVPPGGESGARMTARVTAAFSALRQLPGDTVLVTHGGVIAAIMAFCFPEENKTRYQWQPAPGHGYVLEENTYRVL